MSGGGMKRQGGVDRAARYRVNVFLYLSCSPHTQRKTTQKRQGLPVMWQFQILGIHFLLQKKKNKKTLVGPVVEKSDALGCLCGIGLRMCTWRLESNVFIVVFFLRKNDGTWVSSKHLSNFQVRDVSVSWRTHTGSSWKVSKYLIELAANRTVQVLKSTNKHGKATKLECHTNVVFDVPVDLTLMTLLALTFEWSVTQKESAAQVSLGQNCQKGESYAKFDNVIQMQKWQQTCQGTTTQVMCNWRGLGLGHRARAELFSSYIPVALGKTRLKSRQGTQEAQGLGCLPISSSSNILEELRGLEGQMLSHVLWNFSTVQRYDKNVDWCLCCAAFRCDQILKFDHQHNFAWVRTYRNSQVVPKGSFQVVVMMVALSEREGPACPTAVKLLNNFVTDVDK